MSKPSLDPEDILRVLREGPKTNTQIREALGLGEYINANANSVGVHAMSVLGAALQKLRKQGLVNVGQKNLWWALDRKPCGQCKGTGWVRSAV